VTFARLIDRYSHWSKYGIEDKPESG
jgi:hypothetical protein